MATSVSMKVQPIDDVLKIFLNENLSPEAQSEAFATFAEEQLAEAEETDEYALGRIPPHTTSVDGKEGAPEESVSPKGTIVYEFQIASDILDYITDQLAIHSPIGTSADHHPGLYKHSHILLADGTEVSPDREIPDAKEYIFVNVEPYDRKIEEGESRQAPDGVYEAIAKLARDQYSKIAKIQFGFTSLVGGNTGLSIWAGKTKMTSRKYSRSRPGAREEWLARQPSITVTMK